MKRQKKILLITIISIVAIMIAFGPSDTEVTNTSTNNETTKEVDNSQGFEITNLKIGKSDYTNSMIEADFTEPEKWVNVTFDVNNTGYDDGLELKTIYRSIKLCYETESKVDCGRLLGNHDDADVSTFTSAILKKGVVKVSPMMTHVPVDAYNFKLVLDGRDQNSNKIKFESSVIKSIGE